MAKHHKPLLSTNALLRCLIFISYLVTTCGMAGWIAITFHYPSLFNVNASFWEYAVPLPFNWALAHIPSLLFFGLPLLLIRSRSRLFVRRFRFLCVIALGLTLLEWDNKIPFVLFPKVDAAMALLMSLLLLPPSKQHEPLLFKATIFSIGLILVGATYWGISSWQHRTPTINQNQYVNNRFELTAIKVENNFKREMRFDVIINPQLDDRQVCDAGQKLATALLADYPFDNSYNKFVRLHAQYAAEIKKVGEISLNEQHKENDGRFSCYANQVK